MANPKLCSNCGTNELVFIESKYFKREKKFKSFVLCKSCNKRTTPVQWLRCESDVRDQVLNNWNNEN
ncbi:hypothetical protein Xhom_02032 [Xenorhabdus hominickii]|uniref:Uncharacterized protein n=1 Tax=Xenorhabdus hominickii TaxID=351679 RepID=A0A2G0QBK6_XENHO|nr:hypothetical protein [Xenorhabdus sp. TS4]PHM56539.1 hypothetical protein Xhom_02032 [Xenorhabdus hominickii]